MGKLLFFAWIIFSFGYASEVLEDEHVAALRSTGFLPKIYIDAILHPKAFEYRTFINGVCTNFSKLSQGKDVHALDSHVVQNLAKIHAIGEDLHMGSSFVTKETITAYLKGFIDANPAFYTNYDKMIVTPARLKEFIDKALTTASKTPNVLQMYSRVIDVMQIIEKDTYIKSELKTGIVQTNYQQLFDAIAENYLTQGGCPQGVRNRIYLRYALILSYALENIPSV